ncbi:MAG TPA: alpha/beta hydrolase [Acidimicrobiales bacterium]|nr:alpha/beta hydrolase [Acidimicrobiales bacterium]
MDQLWIDGTQVDYQVEGEGERVMLLHSAAFEPWYEPLAHELRDFAVLRFTRLPPRTESGSYTPLSLAGDAATSVQLLDHLGWESAHAVGHSYGALLALQVARDAPERVGSLALLEPAIRDVPSATEVLASLGPAIVAYRRGETTAAVDGFLQSVAGPDYSTHLDRVLPGAFDTSIDRADLFFQAEMPVVQHWSFGPDEAQDVTQPVLNVVGELSVPRFAEGADLVQTWFPQAERYVLPRAGHLLMVQNAPDLADRLAQFFTPTHEVVSGGGRGPGRR